MRQIKAKKVDWLLLILMIAILLTGCQRLTSKEMQQIWGPGKSTGLESWQKKYPEDYFWDGQIAKKRDYQTDLEELEWYLAVLEAQGIDELEILKVKKLVVNGCYFYVRFGNGESYFLERGKELAREIWDADPDYAKSDVLVYALSGCRPGVH